jgi:hypothetical protein
MAPHTGSSNSSEQEHEETMANTNNTTGAGESNSYEQIPGGFVDAQEHSEPSQQTQEAVEAAMADSLSPIGIANVCLPGPAY